MPEPAPHGAAPWIALAFDFGRRRIGLASADSLTRAARPLGAIQCPPGGIDWSVITQRVQQLQPQHLVVGVPLNADGSPGALTQAAQTFARQLARRFKLPVATLDEHGSSLEATARLRSERSSGLRLRRVRHADVDATAACIILERWLNQT